MRCTRQKRRSVGIVAGSAFYFEERKRARRLKQQIVRAGKRHISTGIIAKRRRMATVFHAAGSARLFVLSCTHLSLPCIRAGDDVFYLCGRFNTPTLASELLIAALGSSAGS